VLSLGRRRDLVSFAVAFDGGNGEAVDRQTLVDRVRTRVGALVSSVSDARRASIATQPAQPVPTASDSHKPVPIQNTVLSGVESVYPSFCIFAGETSLCRGVT